MTFEETLSSTVEQALERALERRLPKLAEELAAKLGAAVRPEVYLSTAKAARIADVTPDTIREWVQRGHLKRCGDGRLRVKASDLAAYLERRKLQPVNQDTVEAHLDRAVARLRR